MCIVSPVLALPSFWIPGLKSGAGLLFFACLVFGPLLSLLFALIGIRKGKAHGMPIPTITLVPGLVLAVVVVGVVLWFLGSLVFGHPGL